MCTKKYYLAVKKNETMNFANKWMDFLKIILSKTQTQKD